MRVSGGVVTSSINAGSTSRSLRKMGDAPATENSTPNAVENSPSPTKIGAARIGSTSSSGNKQVVNKIGALIAGPGSGTSEAKSSSSSVVNKASQSSLAPQPSKSATSTTVRTSNNRKLRHLQWEATGV
ncbi:unnamed protein product [Amoebophrya sp. A25]|nr:unnamed protein product [Amoebophrya sp. A25]|eukprot:GSA25T00019409001.1